MSTFDKRLDSKVFLLFVETMKHKEYNRPIKYWGLEPCIFADAINISFKKVDFVNGKHFQIKSYIHDFV